MPCKSLACISAHWLIMSRQAVWMSPRSSCSTPITAWWSPSRLSSPP
ncbi:hypothetical protein [Moraxella lacunata]